MYINASYRDLVAKTKIINTKEFERMQLKVPWRGDLIFDRLEEPMARPVVVEGANGVFPAYICRGEYFVFDMIECADVAEASRHATAAIRAVILNE